MICGFCLADVPETKLDEHIEECAPMSHAIQTDERLAHLEREVKELEQQLAKLCQLLVE